MDVSNYLKKGMKKATIPILTLAMLGLATNAFAGKKYWLPSPDLDGVRVMNIDDKYTEPDKTQSFFQYELVGDRLQAVRIYPNQYNENNSSLSDRINESGRVCSLGVQRKHSLEKRLGTNQLSPEELEFYNYQQRRQQDLMLDNNSSIQSSNYTSSQFARADLIKLNNYYMPQGDAGHYQLIVQLAKANKLRPELIPVVMAMNDVESDFNSNAVSSKGAKGLMQIMSDTGRMYGVTDSNDLFIPAINYDASIRFLKTLDEKYNSNLSLILAGYNAGETEVDKYNGVPPFRETQDYIRKVGAKVPKYQRVYDEMVQPRG